MTLGDTLRLGPLNLPVRYLVVLAAVVVGYASMSIILRKQREARRAAANRLANSFFIFLVIWKLEPLAARILSALQHSGPTWGSVWLAVFVPGGSRATLLGAVAVVAYLVASILRGNSRPTATPTADDGSQAAEGDPDFGPRRRRSADVGALALALVPAAALYLLAAALLAPPRDTSLAGHSLSQHGAAQEARAPVGTALGDRAPQFTAETLSGAREQLSVSKGKTIVLNFWATWCPPCRAELPELVRFAASRHRSPVEVWAVNLTRSETGVASVRQFAQEHHLDFPVLLDQAGTIAEEYGISAVPTTFIISPDGRIIAKQTGAMSPDWLAGRLGN